MLGAGDRLSSGQTVGMMAKALASTFPLRLLFAAAFVMAFAGAQALAQVAPPPTPALTVDAFLAAPPVGQVVDVTGFIAGEYRCPPCRKGAMCKPCMRPSVIIVAARRGRAPIDTAAPPADVLVIAARNTGVFKRGTLYRLRIRVEDRKKTHRDGRLQRFHLEAGSRWTDDPGHD